MYNSLSTVPEQVMVELRKEMLSESKSGRFEQMKIVLAE